MVGAEALAAGLAVHQRVGEPGQVTGGLPHARVLEDRRVQGDDVVALGEHRAPPLALDVALQQDAVVAVVVGRAEPAVDLRRGEDEAAALAERHDLVHRHDVRASAGLARARGSSMPIYEYSAQGARLRGHAAHDRRSNDRVDPVRSARRPVQRVFHPVAVHFKGSGFYNTDYGTRKRAPRGLTAAGPVARASHRASPRAAKAPRTPAPARRTATPRARRPRPRPRLRRRPSSNPSTSRRTRRHSPRARRRAAPTLALM